MSESGGGQKVAHREMKNENIIENPESRALQLMCKVKSIERAGNLVSLVVIDNFHIISISSAPIICQLHHLCSQFEIRCTRCLIIERETKQM